MLLQLSVTVLTYLLVHPQVYVASTVTNSRGSAMSRQICSALIPETLRILCATTTTNYVRNNTQEKRTGLWLPAWWNRAMNKRENSEVMADDGENDFSYSNLSPRRKRAIVEECCLSSCTFREMTQYCPKRLSSNELLANIERLLTPVTTAQTTYPTQRTRKPGTIVTDRPSHVTIFSIESWK